MNRLILTGIGLLQGGYMLFDGIHVMTRGSYFGGQVGPWGAVVRAVGGNEMKMGPVFIVVGTLWLVAVALLYVSPRRAVPLYAAVALVTLLYPLFGTILSLLALFLLRRHYQSGGGDHPRRVHV